MTDRELQAAIKAAKSLAELQAVLSAFDTEFDVDNIPLGDRGIDAHDLPVFGARPADVLDTYLWDDYSRITVDSRGHFVTVARTDSGKA